MLDSRCSSDAVGRYSRWPMTDCLKREAEKTGSVRQHFGDLTTGQVEQLVEEIIPSARYGSLLGFGGLGAGLRRDQHLHRLRLKEGLVALRFGEGRQGDAFARVERRVADAVGVRKQSLDAGQHPDLRR